MSWGSTEVPEPFRYSRAHSYPPPTHYGGSSQEPEGRGRLLIAALVAFGVVALLGLGIFSFFLRGGPAQIAAPVNPCATPSVAVPAPTATLPDVSDVVPPPQAPISETLEAEPPARPRPKASASATRARASADRGADAVLERSVPQP